MEPCILASARIQEAVHRFADRMHGLVSARAFYPPPVDVSHSPSLLPLPLEVGPLNPARVSGGAL